MITIDQLIQAWNGFFHTPEPYDTVGAFRIVWGALLLASGILMAKDARRYYGPAGLISAGRYQRLYGKSRFSLFQILPESMFSVYFVFSLHLASCVLVVIGLWTRVSLIVCWVTLVSLHHRNPSVVHSGDTVLRLLTFLLIFSHAGDAYSVERSWLAPDPGHAQAGRADEFRDESANDSHGSPWALRLMQLQVSVIYLRTVFWKLRGQRWWNGTAAYFPTQVESFSRIRLPAVLINRFWIALATYGTLLAESSLGGLVWIHEFRKPVLFAGVALHLILELFLNLQFFGWTMIVSFLLFVDPFVVQAWLRC